MTKPMNILSALFIFQFVLLMAFYINNNDIDVFEDNEKLLSINFNKIERVVITNKEGKKVTLTKNSQGWVLSNLYDFPANQEKTEEVLNAFKNQVKSWPVGKTSIAAKKLLTHKDKFEKKFEFHNAHKLMTTLYMGSSPSFKKIHVRVANEKKIYAINFNSFTFPAEVNDWVDRDYYNLTRKEIKSLRVKDILIEPEQTSEDFKVSTLKDTEKSLPIKVNQLVENVLAPGYHKILSKYSYDRLGETVLNYEITTNQGKKLSYSYSEIKKDPKKLQIEKKLSEPEEGMETNLVLKISNIPYYFEVDKSAIAPLMKLKRDSLVENTEDLINKNNLSVKRKENKISKSTK